MTDEKARLAEIVGALTLATDLAAWSPRVTHLLSAGRIGGITPRSAALPIGSIHQINLSKGGVPKLPVMEAEVGALGIVGDRVAHPDIHGGPERALCLFALEQIEALAAEGHPIAPGGVGENITTAGIDWGTVGPGTRLRLGSDLEVEITRYTTPCTTIRGSFSDGDSNRIHSNLHPGWSRAYARVLTGGTIRPGDPVEVLSPVTSHL